MLHTTMSCRRYNRSCRGGGRLMWMVMGVAFLLLLTTSSTASASSVAVDTSTDDPGALASGRGGESNNAMKQATESIQHHNNTRLAYDEDCRDLRDTCPDKADSCTTNWRYMHVHCPQTCGVCHNQTRIEERPKMRTVDAYASGGKYNLGKPQLIVPPAGHSHTYDEEEDPVDANDIRYAVTKARRYLLDVVYEQPRFHEKAREYCQAYSPYCAYFAVQGDCDNTEEYDYMVEHCAPFCQWCHELHEYTRCFTDRNAKHSWYPGDLNRMFERLVSDPNIQQQYTPTVWSEPNGPTGGPWVVTLENFLNATEAEVLQKYGGHLGYQRSEKVGTVERDDGTRAGTVDNDRTSTNAWCNQECREDPVTNTIYDRIQYLTGLSSEYSENLQLLRYEPGQYYKAHHDYIVHDEYRIQGPRILTVYIYLNDVEEGGETRFVDLGLSVEPKLGRVVIWPSVLDADPFVKDDRTFHEARPVTKGIKYGANAWFHLMSTEKASDLDCLG